MRAELATTDLYEFNSGENGETVHVAIHAGKNVEKTMALVRAVYHFKSNFYTYPIVDIAEEFDEDIDTNCHILSSPDRNSLKPGMRIFDIACAYAPQEFVSAMMKHPDTPVGEVHGLLLDRHSSLTFLANEIAGRSKFEAHENFNKYADTRLGVFKLLIEDPRTPVDYRLDTMNGSEMLGVLGLLKRHRDPKGHAYYQDVSELLWQRKAAIATHWNAKDEIQAAFDAASRELLSDSYLRHMDESEKKKFHDDLQQDLSMQYIRCAMRAGFYSQQPGLGPDRLSHIHIDQRVIAQHLGSLSEREAVAAKQSIAQQIWTDCATVACLKNRLVNLGGNPGPDLHRYAELIEGALAPKPTEPALGSAGPQLLSGNSTVELG